MPILPARYPRPSQLTLARPRDLAPGVLIGDVADRSRLAFAAFLRLAADGADRPELASWLFGAYLDALSVGRATSSAAEPSLVIGDAALEESAGAVITSATRSIHGVLRAFHNAADPAVAERLLERGVIERVCDDHAGSGFAPLGEPGMPLAVRVLALVAAEMLTRPERLRADLVVTETSVELAERSIGSGVGMRSRQTLPWTPSREERESAPGWPAAVPTLAELVAAQDGDAANDDGWPT